MKVVLDTNILLSGLAGPNGTPGRIVSAWRAGHYQLATSEPLIAEFCRAAAYPRIRTLFAKTGVSERELRDFADLLRLKALVVDVSAASLPVDPRDANDQPVIATMIAAEAEWLVTGDRRDLLSLGLRNIVTAREFLSRADALRPPPLAEQPRAAYRPATARRKRRATAAQA